MESSSSPFAKCTDRARRVLRLAAALAAERKHPDVQPRDLLEALSHDQCVAAAALTETGFVRPDFPLNLALVSDETVERSEMASRLMNQAKIEATKLEHDYAGSEHQLLALTALHPGIFPDAAAIRLTVLQILGHA